MTAHPIDPTEPILGQTRSLGFIEPLPHPNTVLYRFFAGGGELLYVGVSKRPVERWQAHKRTAPWWPDVAYLTFETHPYERAALDAEVSAIRAERPLFNKRSAPAPLKDSSCAAHAPLTHYSQVTPPRVGGGVGGGERVGVGNSLNPSIHLAVGATRPPHGWMD